MKLWKKNKKYPSPHPQPIIYPKEKWMGYCFHSCLQNNPIHSQQNTNIMLHIITSYEQVI